MNIWGKAFALVLAAFFLAPLVTFQLTLAQTNLLTLTPSPSPNPTMLWQFTPNNYLGTGKYSVGRWSTPTIVDGVVYIDMIGSRNYDKVVPYYEGIPGQTHTINIDDSWGGVYSINATTGILRWFFTGQGTIFSPAVGEDRVFAPLSYWDMGAFNISNGRSLWNLTLATPDPGLGYYSSSAVGISSSPSFSNGRVFFGLTDSNVIALNASTGKTLWTFATDPLYQPGKTTSNDNPVPSTPTVANGIVYVGSTKGYCYALNASSGSKLWSYKAGLVNSAPVVADGRVYFSIYDRVIYSLNITDGTKKWNYTCGNEWVSTPNYDNSYVFVSPLTINNNVVFFNYNGVVGWKDGSFKYLGTVCALNALSGIKLWNSTIDTYSSGALTANNSPTANNGVVYVFSDDQNLYALNAGNGEPIWKYYVGKSIASSKIDNGIAYYCPEKDNLYAFKLPAQSTSSLNPTPKTASTQEHEFQNQLLIVVMFAFMAVAIFLLLYRRKRKTTNVPK